MEYAHGRGYAHTRSYTFGVGLWLHAAACGRAALDQKSRVQEEIRTALDQKPRVQGNTFLRPNGLEGGSVARICVRVVRSGLTPPSLVVLDGARSLTSTNSLSPYACRLRLELKFRV